MILNYTSGKSPAGMGAHNQTRHFGLGWPASGPRAQDYSVDGNGSRTPAIPADRYFLNAVALQTAWLSTDVAQQAFRVQAQRARGEGPSGDGVGWASAYRGAIASSPENWLRWTTADCTALFRRWTGDPELARMDLETDRRWMVLDAASAWIGAIGLLVTYHTIAQTARGTVSGASADATGLLVSLSRDLTGEKVLEVVTTTGGVYEAAWYDDTEALVADVYEDDGHLGRSAPFFASGLFVPPPEPDPDPLYHSASHELGGGDQLDVSGLSGVLAEPQVAATHTTSHQLGGDDELDVSGLSGVLAEPQPPSTHASSHLSGGSDPIAAATTSARGTVELATDGESASGLAVQADDSRLSNARTPTAHASSHASGGSDAIKLDDLATPDDNTDLDATASRHGLLPKLSNVATQVLAGTGAWIPADPIDVQSSTTPGSFTWTKPTRGTMAMIITVGGGGGGGGGASGASSGQTQGGSAGGGGARHIVVLPLSMLGATEPGTIGIAGDGGAAGASGGVANDGSDGRETTFGASPLYLAYAGGGGGGRRGVTGTTSARGGGGGGIGGSGELAGTTTGGSGGGPGVLGVDESSFSSASGGRGAAGGNSSNLTGGSAEYGGGGGGGRNGVTLPIANPGGTSLYGGGGGGCGGGTNTSSVRQAGATGGASGRYIQAGGGGGSGGSVGNNGSAGAAGNHRYSGAGGGGGGGDTTSSAGNGGTGGVPGGGGGGGGTAFSGGTAGAGGDGGSGAIYVFVW